jgi:hypothetical protein
LEQNSFVLRVGANRVDFVITLQVYRVQSYQHELHLLFSGDQIEGSQTNF